MNWLTAITTGFGLGLASFGGLWLTVRQLLCRRQRRLLSGVIVLARLILVGLAAYALSRDGADKLLAGFAGLMLGRWCVIRSVGGS
jgi:F1F0 ATPase subunit 2